MAITESVKETLSVDLAVTPGSLQDDIFQIYRALQPNAEREQLHFEELRGGFVNSIWRVTRAASKSETNPEIGRSLVFRSFGMKLDTAKFNESLNQFNQQKADNATNDNATNDNATNDKPSGQAGQAAGEQPPASGLDIDTLVFNRLTEYQVMNEVSRHKLCQPVYAKYSNGICYGYSEGVVVDGPLMLTRDFETEMATKLAKFHSIQFDMPNIKFKTHFERMDSQVGPMFEHMISAIDAGMAQIDEFPYNEFPKMSSLLAEEQQILALLNEIGFGPITFCHNDVNQKNLIWNPQTRTLQFIDFEMSMNNYLAFEIGQLFFCFAGHFLVDFDGELFPSSNYRRSFLRTYLSQSKEGDFDEEELERLYIRTSLTALFFMLRIILMTPFFDFQPDLFKNEELVEARTKTKWFCGRYGFSVWKYFDEVKDGMMQEARDYLAKTKHTKFEQ